MRAAAEVDGAGARDGRKREREQGDEVTALHWKVARLHRKVCANAPQFRVPYDTVESLAAVVSRMGPLLESEAVGWVIRLARCVEALHQSGAAHGSIAADAILVDGHTPTSSGRLLAPHETARVPGYQCPERDVFGRPTAADDAWAVGVTLYVLLTGSLPHGGGSDVEVRQRMAQGACAPLSVFGVDDEELQGLVDRCLARAQPQRIARVAELRSLLEGWGAAHGVASLPPLDGGAAHAAPAPDEDDDDDNAATQMRDVGDIQALLAAATAAPSPPPLSATPLSPVAPAFPARPASPAAPAFPAVSPAPVLPPGPAREQQSTMRSLGVPPELASRPRPRPAVEEADYDDDEDDGDGATLMLDVGPLDVNAAIAESLNRAPRAPSPARTEPMPGSGSAVDELLDRPWRSSAPGPEPLAGLSGQRASAAPLHAPPAGVLAALPGAASSGNFAGYSLPTPPTGPVPPMAPAQGSEGRGLKIALAIGVVLLVVVVSLVVVLYLKKQG